MKVLITIFIVIVSIVAILLVVALFIKKDYAIQREIIIKRNTEESTERKDLLQHGTARRAASGKANRK